MLFNQFVRAVAVGSAIIALSLWWWPTPPGHFFGYLAAQGAWGFIIAALATLDPQETIPLLAWLAVWAVGAWLIRSADRAHLRSHLTEWRGWQITDGKVRRRS